MSITPYLVGGSALVVGIAVGYVKFMERGTEAREARAETATVAAECATSTAETVNESTLRQIADLQAEVDRQKALRAEAEAKSRDRLRENNLLRKGIQSVKDNPPVSDSLELVLDSLRVRGSVPGNGSPASGADQDSSGETAGADGGGMPAPAGGAAEASDQQHP